MAMRTREAMLGRYKHCEPTSWLRPPFSLGASTRPDELPDLRRALIKARLPGKYLAAVIRAQADLGAVLAQYEAGEFAGLAVAPFRAMIERLYADLAKCLDEATTWLGTLAGESAASTGLSRSKSASLNRPAATSSAKSTLLVAINRGSVAPS